MEGTKGEHVAKRARLGPALLIVMLVVSAVLSSIVFVIPANAVLVEQFRDDFDYNLHDPDPTKWRDIVQQPPGCDPGKCHDMWAEKPPGYLFSDNMACRASLDFSSYQEGRGADARMTSFRALTYDSAGGEQLLILKERFSPGIHNRLLCITAILPKNDEMMHVIGLRYVDAAASSFVRIVIHHSCSVDGWKFYATATYVDKNGKLHEFEYWTERVIEDNQWLELTIDVALSGRSTRLWLENLSTGQLFSKDINTILGKTSGQVEVEVQYRHNEKSRTDFVDFKIEQVAGGGGGGGGCNISCPQGPSQSNPTSPILSAPGLGARQVELVTAASEIRPKLSPESTNV